MTSASRLPGPPGADGQCAFLSEAAKESLWGTAAVAEEWLFVEEPGAWPAKGTPKGLAFLEPALKAWQSKPGRRVQFIRRPGERCGDRRLFFWRDGALLQGCLTDERIGACLANEDWSSLSPAAPQYFVCTHGKRDRCCSVRGIPVFQAFCELAGGRAWQTSHIGGHRFAATLIAMPSGQCLGRVTKDDAPSVFQALETGHLPALSLIRGRVCWPRPAQAAALTLRNREGLSADGDVRLRGCTEAPAEAGETNRFEVSLQVAGKAISVCVAEHRVEGLIASCGDAPKAVSRFEVV